MDAMRHAGGHAAGDRCFGAHDCRHQQRHVHRWAWRIPFLASVVLVFYGVWLRASVDETPQFSILKAKHEIARAPIMEVLRVHWRRVLLGGSIKFGPDGVGALMFVFMLTYLNQGAL